MKTVLSFIPRILISLLLGFFISFMLAVYFFGYREYSSLDQGFLLVIPAFSLAPIFYLAFEHIRAWTASLNVLNPWLRPGLVILALVLLFLLIQWLPVVLLVVNVLIAILLIAGAIYLSKFLSQESVNSRIFSASLLGILPAYWGTSFLTNFYPSLVEVFLLGFLLQLAFSLVAYLLVKKVIHGSRSPAEVFIQVAFFVIFLMFCVAVFILSSQFPNLFDEKYFLLETTQLPFFVVSIILSLPWLAAILRSPKTSAIVGRIENSRLLTLIGDNLLGLLLAGLFFAIYLLLISVLSDPSLDVDDIFFDADALNWRLRLTTEDWADYYWRSIHPLALLVLRLPIAGLAMFLKGDMLSAAYVIVSLAGASCVFMAWAFISKTSGNSTYALMVAALLGSSASHLVFGSLIETYVFLAASMMLFYLLLLEDGPFVLLVSAGLVTIGITLTNFAQNVIALFLTKLNVKLVIRFIFVVLVVLVFLSLLSELIYPGANPFIKILKILFI